LGLQEQNNLKIVAVIMTIVLIVVVLITLILLKRVIIAVAVIKVHLLDSNCQHMREYSELAITWCDVSCGGYGAKVIHMGRTAIPSA
jgi:hypothetical protein